MAFQVGSDSNVPNVTTGHTTAHNNWADLLGMLFTGQGGGVINVKEATYGAVGDGVTDDTAAIQAAINAGAGGEIFFPVGKYLISSPLTVPPYTSLQGMPNTTQVSQTNGGSVLMVSSSFTGLTVSDGGSVLLKGAIALLGQAFGGYSTVTEEIKINNLMINGSSGPASVHGILSYGRTQRVRLNNVLVSQTTGDGITHLLDVASEQPDAWYGKEVFSRFNSGKGFNLRSADSTWYLCLSSNNGDTGVDWFINTCSNSKFLGCRSEHASGIGFGYVCVNSGNSSGGVLFSGCSTDQSNLHGMQVGGTINGITSQVHSVALTLSGCVFRRDGANSGSGGGGYAGFYNADYGGQVTLSGITVWPGVNDNGSGTNSPQIGLLADSGSLMNITGAYIQGATTAITDNSGGGINYDNSVVTATGTTGSPSINASPNIAAYQGASLHLTPVSSPATDPLFIMSAASGNRAFGIRVSGQNNDVVKLTSDTKLAFGGGASTQDVSINRPSAGILSVTDSGFGGSAMMRVAASTAQTSTTELFSAVCNASGDVSYIAKVTGDTQNRWRNDSNGQMQWGSGSSAPDCTLDRQAANIMELVSCDLDIATAGKGLRIKEGSNAKQGTVTLTSGGLGTVATTAVTANSRIHLTTQSPGGTVGAPYVNSVSAGSSFVVKSTSSTDTSTVAYTIIEPG